VEVMENNLIMFGSVTLAMKSRNLLLKNNIKSGLVRTPIHLNKKSCGYSLYVPGNFEKALKIIRSNGITVNGTAAVDNL
jgi:hypothetical protein